MAKKQEDRNREEEGKKPDLGRVPMFDDKMVRSSFTAPDGVKKFLREFGGEGTVSAGIRRCVELVVASNDIALHQARMIQRDGYSMGNALDPMTFMASRAMMNDTRPLPKFLAPATYTEEE